MTTSALVPCPNRCDGGESVISGDPRRPATREDISGIHLETRECTICRGSVQVSPRVAAAYRDGDPGLAAALHYEDTHPQNTQEVAA